MTSLYPIYLRLDNQKCIVVGGGKIATRKVNALLACGAVVKVISPNLTWELMQMVSQQRIIHVQRSYHSGDLQGAILVISATNNKDINHQVVEECSAKNILVNVVDDPVHCDFYVPSVVRQGSLCISISTAGKSPLLAKKLRQQLQSQFGTEYGILLDILNEARSQVLTQVTDPEKKKEILNQLTDQGLLILQQEKNAERVKERVLQCLSSLLV